MNNLFFEKNIQNNQNKYHISLINGIRRSMMCDIEVYCVDMDQTIFYENTSVTDNEFLNKRLHLTPILSDFDDVIYENIRIECKMKNNTQDITSVYVKDFIIKDENDKIINKNFFAFPDILFTRLKPNQVISFETRLKKDNSQFGGAAYNPTCTCVHTFEMDENAVKDKIKELALNETESKSFMLDDAYQIYKKNNVGNPLVYKFNIESVGHLPPNKIFTEGIQMLKARILNAKNEMNTKNSEKITITKNKKSDDVFDVVFMYENDTLGNILSEYMSEDPEIKYVGYRLPHPQKYEMHMKISLEKENTKENIAKKYLETMTKIIKILDTIS